MVNSIYKKDIGEFRVKIGTFNKKEPKSIYVENISYVIPEDIEDFSKTKSILSNILVKSIKKNLKSSNFFDSRFISVVDISTERMKNNKKTYLSLEYHLKPLRQMNFKEIYQEYDYVFSNILNSFEEYAKEEGLTFSKNK